MESRIKNWVVSCFSEVLGYLDTVGCCEKAGERVSLQEVVYGFSVWISMDI